MPFFPTVPEFFDHFDKHVSSIGEGVTLIDEMLSDLSRSSQKARRIKEVEHEADVTAHETLALLHQTFITPFDREVIHRLMSGLDDIIDHVEATAERLVIYDIETARPESFELVRILTAAVDHVRKGVAGLRHVKRSAKDILAACVDINRLENEGDEVLRQSLARLFREETDPLLVMKWKEVFETLEEALDSCEDVADILEGIVLENA